MKKNRIALFANHQPSVDVARFLKSRHVDEVCALYLSGKNTEIDQKIIEILEIPEDLIFYGSGILKSDEHNEWFKEQCFDAIICVYWPWLLEGRMFASVRLSVNFHPALLPVNRGWFPHVHSLIDGSPCGVTLHQVEQGADTGAIWAQKQVDISPLDTARSLYLRLQKEIVDLFVSSWEQIIEGNIEPCPQNEINAVYHAKNEIDELDFINLDKTVTTEEFINLLRARSFGDKGFAYFIKNGNRVYLNLRLSESSSFDCN